jgi:hypothetical protein
MPHDGENMTVKTIGRSGQIALGKRYAGRQVHIEEIEPGVWVMKLGEFIPDNERWLHQPEVEAVVDKAIRWAEENKPTETALDELNTLGTRTGE